MSISHTGIKRKPHTDEGKLNISLGKISQNWKISSVRRKETMLSKDKDIFKKIGEKSSETQRKNALNKGSNNPNYNNNDLIIYDKNDNEVFITKLLELSVLCTEHNLPMRCLIKSYRSDGVYKLYLKQKPRNIDYEKFIGWYCKIKR